MTEWDKQNILAMSDIELDAELPKWPPTSDHGIFARAEMERRSALFHAVKQNNSVRRDQLATNRVGICQI